MDPIIPQDHLSDEHYLDLYNLQDPVGWGYMYRKFFPELSAYAAYILKSTTDSENIASEVLTDKWPPDIKFETLPLLKESLLRAVRNKCLNHKKILVLHTLFPDEMKDTTSEDPDAAIRRMAKIQEVMDLISQKKGLSKDFIEEVLLGGKKNSLFAKERNLSNLYVAKIKNRLIAWIKKRIKF